MKIPLAAQAALPTAAAAAIALATASLASAPDQMPLSLGGVTVGASILDIAKRIGPPDLVQTGDTGHEWRWYDRGGLDRDVLTDDDLIVRRVRVARPQPAGGKPAKLVQPAEASVLESSIDEAAKALESLGARALPEPVRAARAWRWRGGVVVAETKGQKVAQLLALDNLSAQRAGYISGGATSKPYHAPRYDRVGTVGYPRRAADAGIGGVVIVRVEIDAQGAVRDVRVIVSSGDIDLDNAEIASIRQSTFRSALCGGVACGGVLLDREEYVP